MPEGCLPIGKSHLERSDIGTWKVFLESSPHPLLGGPTERVWYPGGKGKSQPQCLDLKVAGVARDAVPQYNSP